MRGCVTERVAAVLLPALLDCHCIPLHAEYGPGVQEG